MSFTDKFFEFPVRIYEGTSLSDILEPDEDAEEPLWIEGDMRIPGEWLTEIRWHDYFNEEEGVKGAIAREEEEEGTMFNQTMIFLKTGDFYICPWTKKKFEMKLNQFVDRMNKIYEEAKTKSRGTGTY